eukprot:CAMPEP_0170061850 /NCGR_PEP_ID=MMETSP0019_2-20121128/3275_1 /TAXON_ID=98059 /ORGANISM="Dinobryon sp., Strain UTEXLB2267" /LENGTH=421 /DNA_ID=CAMNT_0010267807 /DNA_START=398 /DNA_END=1663 /DNA_ORIENTATION=+
MTTILQKWNCTPNPVNVLRLIVELLEVNDLRNEDYGTFSIFTEEKYVITLRSLFIQGLHANAPNNVRYETLHCLLNTLSLTMSWTLTEGDLSRIEQKKETETPASGIFPVFLSSIISGEIHILLEQVLAMCEDKSTSEKLAQCGNTLEMTLQMLVLILSALVMQNENDSTFHTSWANLPALSLLTIKQHLDHAMKDSLDFLRETQSLLSSNKCIPTEASWQCSLLSIAEKVVAMLAAFAVEDDTTMESILNNMPTLLWISSQSSSNGVLNELVNCVSQRCADLEGVEESDEEALLFSMLDLDSPLLLHAASTVLQFLHASDETDKPPQPPHLQLVASCCCLLAAGCRHWTKQAKRMKVPLSALLRTFRDVEMEAAQKGSMGIFDTLSALREPLLQKDGSLEELKLLNVELQSVWKQLRVTS